MPLAPVNNPPAPVQEGVGPAVPDPAECAAIKEEFGIDVDTYDNHAPRKSEHYQSHHILQNEAMEAIIAKGEALCVLLVDRFRGTEHQTITRNQNKRMNNKKRGKPGPKPAANFGGVKDQAKADLSEGLAGKRTSNKTGKPMTKEEADKAAECIVAEAEQAAKDAADDKGMSLDDATTQGINQPGGCLARGTAVWLAGGDIVAVEDVRPGDWVQTTSGPQVVARIDGCHHDLVEIDLGDEVLTIASFHRVLLADGVRRRADALRAGDRVSAIGGTRVVADMRVLGPQREPVYRIGCRGQVVCAVGRSGIWTVMPEAGPRVDRAEIVVPFVAQEAQPCPS